jgi:autotransporter-associated beta strand protein
MKKGLLYLGTIFAWLLLGLAAVRADGSNAMDRIDFGNASSEAAHYFGAGSSGVLPTAGTGAMGQSYRAPLKAASYPATFSGVSQGGQGLLFTMAVDPNKQNYLTIRLWGGDNSTAYTYFLGYTSADNGLDLSSSPAAFPNRFYYSTEAIPLAMTQGKTLIQLVLYQSNFTNGPGRPIYSAYTHTDPHFIPTGADPTGTKLAVTGQLPLSTLSASQIVSYLQTNRQNVYQNTGTAGNPSDYYDQILARQVTAGTTGAPPEAVGLDLYNNVANWAAANPNATPDQWRDQCGSGGHGPGYTTAPDEMLSVLTATYFLPPFTDANGNTVAGLDHYHDATIISRIVSCLDGTSYLQSSDGHYQAQPYAVWNGVTSTPRAAGHAYAGSTSRGPGWSLSLEGADTETIGRVVLQLLNDPTAAPIFESYLTQSYDADLDGGSMMRAYAYERMLNNQVDFLYTIGFAGTISQGLMNILGTYSQELALAKLQALYPYPGTTSTFPNDSYSYPINYPAISQAQATSRMLQITGAEAAVDFPELYYSGATNYAISIDGFGEAHGSISGGYDGRYGTILPWIANRLSALAANDSTLSSQNLTQIRTQAQASANGYLHFISALENYQGGNDLFTLAQEDFITYRDPYGTNADSGSFTVGAGYEASDPTLGVNSALQQRGAYLEALYSHPPGRGKGGNDQLQYLATMGSFESTVRGLINANPSTLTGLPGEPGQPNSAMVDPETGTTAVYYNGERLYMNNNYRNFETQNPQGFGTATNRSRIHDTTSTVDRDETAIMPHDSTSVQSDGNLSGGINQPWVTRFGNWLVAGNPNPNTSSSTLTLPAGAGLARDVVSNNTYSMGSTITIPVGGSVAINMPIPTTTQQIASGTYILTNMSSKLLLDCPGGANTPGLQMDQAAVPSTINTEWTFTYVGNGLYTIVNSASGLYLSGSGSQGAGAVQQPADGQADQQWQLIQSGDSYVLVNQATGLAVNDPGASNNPGTGMILWTQDAGTNSAWSFQAVSAPQIIPNGTYTVASFQTNFVLDDPGSSTSPGQNILKNVPTGGTDQQWVFTYQGNGQYTIKNAASGLYLTPSGLVGSFYYPAVEQEPVSGASNQLWTVGYNNEGYNLVNADTGIDALSDQNDPSPGNPAQMNEFTYWDFITWEIRPATITAPAAPTNLTAHGSTGSVTLNWTASSGAVGYDVKRSATNGSGYTVVAYNVTALTYTDTSVTNGTIYYYVVSAVSSGGESANSAQATTGALAAPTGLAAVSGDSSVSLSWAATADASSYNVLRSVTTGGPYTAIATGVSSPAYNDMTAADGTTYYYVVTAVAPGAQSGNSSEVNATPLATPTGLLATAGNGAITLTWSSVAGATSYNILRSLTSGSGYTPLASGVSTSAYSDTAVSNGIAYYYEIQAVNASGAGGISTPISATPVSHSGSWIGGGADSNWQTAANWTSLPTAGQQLYFDGTTGLSNNNNFAANTAFSGLTFEGTAGAFVLTGNAISLGGAIVNNSANLETINLGLVLTNTTTPFNAAAGNITVGGVISDGSNTYGITKAGAQTLTLNGANTFKGGVTVNSGTVFIGNNSAMGTGTITLAGGTLSYGYYNNFNNPVNVTGSATMVNTGDQSDGNHTGALTGTGTLTIAPTASSWKWNGSMSAFAGTFIANTNYNIIFEGAATSGSAAAKFQVDGYCFYDEGATGTTFNMGELSGVGAITANGSGMVTFQVGALNTSTTYSGSFGDSSGTIALNKIGTGTLSLTNASTYSGGTTITAGTLLVGNTTGSALGTGAITVSSGATLGGIGSVSGAVTVATGGNLATGLGGTPGVLNLNALTLNGGGALNLTLAAPPSSYGVALNGAFAASGTTTVNIIALSGFGPGSYPVITGAQGISAANFAMGIAPAGYTYSLVVSGSNLYLNVSAPAAPTNLAATSGVGLVTLNWTAAAGATGYNVKRSLTTGGGYTVLASGVTTTTYQDTTVSNGTPYYYVVSATNLAGESPNSNEATGNPTSTPFTWTGNGADNNWLTTGNWSTAPVAGSPLYFSGTTGLTSNNNIAANTQFSGITFNSGAGAFTLTGNPINLSGAIVNNSTSLETIGLGLVLTSANTNIYANSGGLALNGVISDGSNSYALTVYGPQTVTLNGANTFKGGVTLSSGTLAVGNATALGTGTLTLAGGTLQYGSNVNFGNAVNITGSVTMNNTGDQGDGFHTGALTGSGTLTIAPTASSWKWNGAMSGFSGTLIATTASSIIFQGSAANGSAAANFQVNGSNFCSQGASGSTFNLGQLSGSGAMTANTSGTITFQMGALNTNSTYGGTFFSSSGTIALSKVGTGALTLSGANTYSGGTTITAGALLITNTTGSALGTGAVTVASGGTLGGTGTNSGATTVASGGILAPGLSGAAGVLNLAALTLSSGSTLNMDIATTTTSDKVVVTGTYRASGTTTINLNAMTGFGVGTYPLITGATGISAASFVLGTAPSGYTCTFSVTGSTLSLVVSVPPPAPGGFTATPTFGQVALAWTASPGATSYHVKRSTTTGGPYATIATTSNTSYIDTSVTNGIPYYYVVTGVNPMGEGMASLQAAATTPTIPSPWVHGDIGTTGATGSASYSKGTGTMTIVGAGADITGTSDAFQFVYQTGSGDCYVVAKIATVQNTNTLAKAGVMIRETTAANSRFAGLFVTPGSGLGFLARSTTGGIATISTKTGITAPQWVMILRTGNGFVGYYSSNGTAWSPMGSTTIAMATSTSIGLAVTSKVSGTLCTATVTNITAAP